MISPAAILAPTLSVHHHLSARSTVTSLMSLRSTGIPRFVAPTSIVLSAASSSLQRRSAVQRRILAIASSLDAATTPLYTVPSGAVTLNVDRGVLATVTPRLDSSRARYSRFVVVWLAH